MHMTTVRNVTLAAGCLVVALALSGSPAAAAARVWVASTGGGAACSHAAPCATFQAAHTAVDVGGEISCIDSGDYGSIDISKDVTIDCSNVQATINIGIGIAVQMLTSVTVTLRGLAIHGRGTAGIGIHFQGPGELHIERCRVSGFAGEGISIDPQTATPFSVTISDTVVAGNASSNGAGISIQKLGVASPAVGVMIVLDRVQVENNPLGIMVDGTGLSGVLSLQMRDSVVAGSKRIPANPGTGITGVSGGGATVGITVDHSSVAGNDIGIAANGARAFVTLGRSTVISNQTGLSGAFSASLFSYGNNQLTGNVDDGSPVTGIGRR
jgi:parallel beta helix pectate lyase-like protein